MATSAPITAGGPASDADPASRTYRLRWWTLVVLSLSLLIIIIDDTIINVAIPTLQRELGASAAGLQWIADAFILSFAGLLLTMGTLGDRFGRRRFLELGLVVFALSSLFGAYATSTGQLIAARALMGVGGALIMPATLSVLIDVFPRDERVKAIGIWTGVASLGIPLGPVVSGWLLERFWWGSIFLVNIPIAIVALVAGRALVPESRHPAAPRADVAGMLLSTITLTSLVYSIIEIPSAGWASGKVLGGLAVATLGASAFLGHEGRVAQPMLDLELFRNPRLGWGTAAITVAAFALAGMAFNLTQFLQFVQGYSPLQAGLRFLPIAAGFGVAGPLSQKLVARFGSARVIAGGLGFGAATLPIVGHADADTTYWLIGTALFLFGLGIGTAFVPATDAVMAAVPEANAGLGSAINDAARQVGAALGIGVLGAVVNGVYASQLGDSIEALDPGAAAAAEQSVGAALQVARTMGGSAGDNLQRAATAAFAEGFTITLLIAAGMSLLGAVTVLHRLPARDASVALDVPLTDSTVRRARDPVAAPSRGPTAGDANTR